MKSLDPRVNRLPELNGELAPKAPLDQLGTFEVFTQLHENKPYIHTGAVHAPNEEMAFLFAKEQFSRRQTCTGLFVVDTRNVYTTGFTEDDQNIYSSVPDQTPGTGNTESYEVFHLMRRGKQHEHIGSVEADSYQGALSLAKPEFIDGKPVFNVWVVKTSDILFNDEEDKIIWNTLPEKQFRDAIAYKAGDKLKDFKERKQADQ
ncbi:phenylacetic acid degradation b [Fulvivirga sedimenti]|uniref:Phenylacetic acid degradation b n=1 Tax=Fulvivirga sedimenti TaxID=2879465 RepID=A0A9X1HR24_9BACT|nr:phenylacetic acid degradation b [Fulvivirga sedimenti]MCA6075233.1 phenylacetic acid degradation b [Fulvivirga sedimenti]MCA6076410.1 phenylacetic acid degradation b [Fulvivirga sedimenti]MCA6077538.1 phenylacetic acid degradation b [Fulvivirga sedimenti]